MKKVIISLLLAVVMIASLFPVSALSAVAAEGTDTVKAISFGVGAISGYDAEKGYNYVYYGEYNGEPIKWRVLDDQNNNGNSGLFLLSDEILHLMSYDIDGDVTYKENNDGEWGDSTARTWLQDFAGISGTAVEDAFSETELYALLPTIKSDGEYKITMAAGEATFGARENNLYNDEIFLLSIEEAHNASYGFVDDASRIAQYNGTDTVWWLRSPMTHYIMSMTYSFAGIVTEKGLAGGINLDGYTYDYGIRPAFNLIEGAIIYAEPAVGGDTSMGLGAVGNYSGNEWKMNVRDYDRSFYVTTNSFDTKPGETITVSYEGAKTGENEYISGILTDSRDNVLYHGRLALAAESGTVDVDVPIELTSGRYTLKMFNEQVNGDKTSDNVSNVANITLSVTQDRNNIDYIDNGGRLQTAVDCHVVGDNLKSFGNAWYIVEHDVTISERIAVSGSANLILSDGATLTLEKGIELTAGNSLTVYGQSKSNGVLTVTADSGNAGIGGSRGAAGSNGAKRQDGGDGSKGGDCGELYIYGGVVDVSGGEGAPAIGGGVGGNGGSGGNGDSYGRNGGKGGNGGDGGNGGTLLIGRNASLAATGGSGAVNIGGGNAGNGANGGNGYSGAATQLGYGGNGGNGGDGGCGGSIMLVGSSTVAKVGGGKGGSGGSGGARGMWTTVDGSNGTAGATSTRIAVFLLDGATAPQDIDATTAMVVSLCKNGNGVLTASYDAETDSVDFNVTPDTFWSLQSFESTGESTLSIENNKVAYTAGNYELTATFVAEEHTHEFNERTDICPCGAVRISEKTFPDENFRSYLNEAFSEFTADGIFTQDEIELINGITCDNCQISNLTGIEYFTELTDLECSFNFITTLDISKNTKLTYVNVGIQIWIITIAPDASFDFNTLGIDVSKLVLPDGWTMEDGVIRFNKEGYASGETQIEATYPTGYQNVLFNVAIQVANPHTHASAEVFDDCARGEACLCGDVTKAAVEHNFSGDHLSDADGHWHKCENCAVTDTKEAHNGTASCTARAVCSVCNTEYGELLSHSFTIAQGDETHHWNKCEYCDETDERLPNDTDATAEAPIDENNGALIAWLIGGGIGLLALGGGAVVLLGGGGFALWWFVFRKKRS